MLLNLMAEVSKTEKDAILSQGALVGAAVALGMILVIALLAAVIWDGIKNGGQRHRRQGDNSLDDLVNAAGERIRREMGT